MRRETINNVDLRPHGIIDAKNADLPRTLREQPTTGTERLKADENNGIPVVRQALNQMMENAAACSHAVGGNDDRRKAMLVDCLGFFDSTRELDALRV